MKELSIEQKAEAYGEAIERAKKVLLDCTPEERKVVEYISPELKEIGDEKIRKELIAFVKSRLAGFPQCEKYVAWIEKQGDKESQVKLPTFTFDDILALQCCMESVKKVQEDKDLYDKLNDLHSRVYDAYHLEKQCEKPQGKSALDAIKEEKVDNQNCVKPTEKKEPKFREGDNIQFKGPGHNRYTIKEVCGLSHYVNTMGNRMDMSYTDANFNLVEQNLEWSEDDEIRHKATLDDLEALLEYIKREPSREFTKYHLMSKDSLLAAIQKDIDWFRTLKDRIQPQNTWKMSEDKFAHIVGCLVQDVVANEHMPEEEKQPTKVFVEKYYKKLREE